VARPPIDRLICSERSLSVNNAHCLLTTAEALLPNPFRIPLEKRTKHCWFLWQDRSPLGPMWADRLRLPPVDVRAAECTAARASRAVL
jgi:hypothetical protein